VQCEKIGRRVGQVTEKQAFDLDLQFADRSKFNLRNDFEQLACRLL
jgi:hypothetical protein